MKRNSIKYSRMNGEVQRELSKIISLDIKDPRIHPMTSIVAVEVAPDLKTAKIYVSVLGDKQAQEDTVKGLKSAAPFLRRELAHSLNLRNTPQLFFTVDQSIEYGVKMSKMINDVTKDMPVRDEEEEEVEE